MTDIFYDKFNEPIEDYYEAPERELVERLIEPHHKVLELGGRYGVVSCLINKKLMNPTHHLVVEPDPTVLSSLLQNRDNHKCGFGVFPGAVSEKPLVLELEQSDHKYCGWGNFTRPPKDNEATIQTRNLQQLQDETGVQYDVLFADCEGALQQILLDSANQLHQFEVVAFEKDGTFSNYDDVDRILKDAGFYHDKDDGLSIYRR